MGVFFFYKWQFVFSKVAFFFFFFDRSLFFDVNRPVNADVFPAVVCFRQCLRSQAS